MGSVRIVFRPQVRITAGELPVVAGATLTLTSGGSETSQVDAVPKSSELLLRAATFRNGRPGEVPEFIDIARAKGLISIEPETQRPVFHFDDPARLEAIEQSSGVGEGDAERLTFPLSFDRASFGGAPPFGTQASLVPLPQLSEGERFCELRAELTVRGSVEASEGVNDRLDIPLKPLLGRQVQLQLKAHDGTLLVNSPYEVEGPYRSFFGVTDGEGLTEELLIDDEVPVLVTVDGDTYELFRDLQPERTLRGKSHLNALGFNAGPLDRLDDRRTRKALGAFQKSEGLVLTFEFDSATLTRLDELVDSGN